MHKYRSFLCAIILKFIDFMTASQHWSDSYALFLLMFDKYLARHYPDSNELTQEMVDDWCKPRGKESANSCLARTNVVIALIRYMQKRNLTKVKEPDRPKKQKCTHIPHAFTKDELTRFFYACDHIKVSSDRKDYAVKMIRKLILCVIFSLMLCAGLRPNEARELRRSDVDLEHGILNIVMTKGHDQHYAAVHESMLEILREYDRRMNALVPDRVYFFPNGQQGFRSRKWLNKQFGKLWHDANPSTHAISYDFRHNYAIENINSWIDCGFDFYDKLYYLSKSMGHCNVEHTKYYYSIVPRMAEILEEKSGKRFDELIPEVGEDEDW